MSITYLGFLRGINVGGNKTVKMSLLKELFESLSFTSVKTFLNSGNIRFDSTEKDLAKLKKIIETNLEKTFGFEIQTIIRTKEEIEKIIHDNPFKKFKVTPQTRLYVTFLSEKPITSLKIPYKSTQGDFTILEASTSEIYSVLVVSPSTRSVDAMNIIEKEWGKKVTTRNWNTIVKMINPK